MNCFHSISSNDFIKASKLLVSIVPADLPSRASFMAAIVSSLGSENTASIKEVVQAPVRFSRHFLQDFQ